MTTTLGLFKGKTWGTCEIRDEFASLLVGIEQARPDCHRFLFGELETRTDPGGRRVRECSNPRRRPRF